MEIPYKDLTDVYVRSGDLRVIRFFNHSQAEVNHSQAHLEVSFQSVRTADYEKLVPNEMSKAKVKDTQSLPLIDNGDLPLLPATRIHHPLHEHATNELQTRLRLHRQLQQLPQPEVSYRMNHPNPSTLSEHAIPRSELHPNQRDEFVQVARASQIQQVIELCLRRDRDGLRELAKCVNVGALIGVLDLEPNNLQFMELWDGTPFLFSSPVAIGNVREAARRQRVMQRNRKLRLDPRNHWLGFYQMIAAGLMRPAQFNLVRRLTRARHNQ